MCAVSGDIYELRIPSVRDHRRFSTVQIVGVEIAWMVMNIVVVGLSISVEDTVVENAIESVCRVGENK